ncbi:MAG: hypothetical protein L6Q37_10775 [Bdellovibrionaceae bacterium]|nr:hypothetical protein [Pseudobdellovibrionaceae bacterium]NUM58670.1 hypothetical protein [Pseudobdellovibrionaceae bacterium]
MRKLIGCFLFICQCSLGVAKSNHLITQSMAVNFNNQIPQSFQNDPKYLTQIFVPRSWVSVIKDEVVGTDWDRFLNDSKNPNLVRVLIHPFDEITLNKVKVALKKANIKYKPSQFEIPFYLTESRSLYPTTVKDFKIPVSPRLSMSSGFGKWKGNEEDVDMFGNFFGMEYNKMISSEQAEFSIEASRIIQKKLNGSTKGDFFEIQPERMVIKINSPYNELNLGLTFRDISTISTESVVGIPSFVQQTFLGSELLAYANGYDSAYDYLYHLEAKIRGRALAEFFVRTGFVHSSPHSQNFVLKADNNFRLNGVLSIRDLPDLIPTYDSRLLDPAMASLFENFEDAREALRNQLDGGTDFFAFRHSFLKGSEDERILTYEQKREIELATSNSFINTLSFYSGVSSEDIRKIVSHNFYNVESDYAITFFQRNSQIWNNILTGIKTKLAEGVKARVEEKPRKFEIVKGQDEINSNLLKIIRKRLSSEKIEAAELAFIKQLWVDQKKIGFSQIEVSKIITIMIAAEAVSQESYLEVYLAANSEHQRDELMKSLLKGSFSDKLAFLRQIIKKFHSSEKFVESAEKKRLLYRVTNILNQNNIPPEILEASYFAFVALSNPEYKGTDITMFMKLFPKIGLTKSVKEDLVFWKKNYPNKDSWYVDNILKSSLITTIYSCLKNY